MVELNSNDDSVFHLIKSVFVTVLTFLLVSSIVVNPFVTDALIESNMLSNGRYAIIYDAHQSIEDFEGFKATAIGSSIIRDAVDGLCISQNLDSEENAGIFNLGISGGNPYTEMIQTQAIVNSQVDLVILELGPNNLWQFYDSKSLNDYIEFRFTLNSITMEQDDIGGWTELLREQDEAFVAFSLSDRIKMTKMYSIESVELEIEKISERLPEIDFSPSELPSIGDEEWLDYLMTPTYKPPNFELKTSAEVKSYFDENMPNLANGSIYKPKSENTLNHLSYEYILQELTSSGINVLLLGIPHHPQVYHYLSENQLDGFNSTFSKYSKLEGVYGMNMFWEEWPEWMFRDRNHLGSFGREYACERISMAIDEINTNKSSSNFSEPTLHNFLESTSECFGSNLSWTVISEYTIIQSEAFSFCSNAKDRRLPHSWEKNPSVSGISLVPDVGKSPKEVINGPMVGYNISIFEPGWYYFWFETRGDSFSDDTFAVSFERPGLPETSFSIISSFSQGEGDWLWTNESTMAPLKMWVPTYWEIKMKIWMQEDGVEINRILISKDPSFIPTLEVF